MKVVAIVGPIASGKSVVSDMFKKKGFVTTSLRDRVRESLDDQGIAETREKMMKEGNRLRETHGPDILAKMTMDKVSEENGDKVVVEAVRNYHEAQYLREKHGAYIVGINAPARKRFELLKKRARTGDLKTYEEFKKIDDKEMEGSASHVQNVNKTLQIVDHTIENDGTLEELKQKVESLVDQIL